MQYKSSGFSMLFSLFFLCATSIIHLTAAERQFDSSPLTRREIIEARTTALERMKSDTSFLRVVEASNIKLGLQKDNQSPIETIQQKTVPKLESKKSKNKPNNKKKKNNENIDTLINSLNLSERDKEWEQEKTAQARKDATIKKLSQLPSYLPVAWLNALSKIIHHKTAPYYCVSDTRGRKTYVMLTEFMIESKGSLIAEPTMVIIANILSITDSMPQLDQEDAKDIEITFHPDTSTYLVHNYRAKKVITAKNCFRLSSTLFKEGATQKLPRAVEFIEYTTDSNGKEIVLRHTISKDK
jgi:hypothetical protein